MSYAGLGQYIPRQHAGTDRFSIAVVVGQKGHGLGGVGLGGRFGSPGCQDLLTEPPGQVFVGSSGGVNETGEAQAGIGGPAADVLQQRLARHDISPEGACDKLKQCLGNQVLPSLRGFELLSVPVQRADQEAFPIKGWPPAVDQAAIGVGALVVVALPLRRAGCSDGFSRFRND